MLDSPDLTSRNSSKLNLYKNKQPRLSIQSCKFDLQEETTDKIPSPKQNNDDDNNNKRKDSITTSNLLEVPKSPFR